MEPWIDISVPLCEGIEVWPGDPPLRITRVATIESGDSCNVSAISMCLHTGTHLDAPLHYWSGSAAVESVPLTTLIGPARVAGLRDGLEGIQPGERILLKSGEPKLRVTPAMAQAFVAGQVVLVGIDALSIGTMGDEGDEVHRILLAAGICILEGLDLSRVEPGHYELICLPLSLPGADGVPARAIVRKV